jgi:2-oxoglutarate ferredoxin oxidoreductase subunit beta
MDYDKYLRLEKFPLIWCPGCGDGIVLKASLRAVDRLALDRNKICMVSGIGCSSRTSGYVDVNTLHTTHGRALTFATGIKMARPDLTVIVVTGDGDATAIGGNITVLLYNNWIYGMTGGQGSPATPAGKRTTTSPLGAVDPGFDIAQLAAGAGASFVARETVAKPLLLDKVIERAIKKKGFSLVEVMTPCPTTYGRLNRAGDGAAMTRHLQEHSVSAAKAETLSEEERGDAVVTGVFVDVDKPEYTAQYAQLVESVGGPARPAPETTGL